MLPMKTRGLWPMTKLKGLRPGAVMAPPRALAHYRLWLQTSSPGVLPLPEPPDGLWSLPDPPPHGLWPTLVPAWKRSMCHSSLSVRVHHRRFSLALIVALRLIVSSSILPRHLMGLSGIPSVKKLSQARQ